VVLQAIKLLKFRDFSDPVPVNAPAKSRVVELLVDAAASCAVCIHKSPHEE
jgi:hypothetical protein